MMHSSCWREIGISGDRSCVELTTLIHCRNCSIYTRNARQVFDRPIPETLENAGNSQVETLHLNSEMRDAASAQEDEIGRNAVAIFRLEQEWFALPATLFHSIVPWASARPIPHRSNDILQGLVNVRGELLLCVSLARLLELPVADRPAPQHRLAIIEWEGDRWTFPVDEFQGIETIPAPTLLTPPATVLKAAQTYTHSLLPWSDRTQNHAQNHAHNYVHNHSHNLTQDRDHNRNYDRTHDRIINCLDETLLFDALARKAML